MRPQKIDCATSTGPRTPCVTVSARTTVFLSIAAVDTKGEAVTGVPTWMQSVCPGMAPSSQFFDASLCSARRTAAGLERSRRGNWKHGYYSAQAKAQRAAARASRRKLQELIAELRARGIRL